MIPVTSIDLFLGYLIAMAVLLLVLLIRRTWRSLHRYRAPLLYRGPRSPRPQRN